MSQKVQRKTTEEQASKLPVQSVDRSATVEERLTDNALENILPARYLNKDSDGNIIEDAEGMFDRVAKNVAQAEHLYTDDTWEAGYEFEYWRGEFEDLMKTLQFIPNSPTLMNAGLELQQLSACFVLEPEDDMDHILDTAREAGLIFKSGGGVGYTFSKLRPKGTLVGSTKGGSSGPVSFMRLYDEVCQQVKQGGKRRGAQMGIMRVDHPDIGRFITAKREEGALSNFNISVGVTDRFKEAVEHGDYYLLGDPQHDFDQAYTENEATYRFYHPDHEDEGDSIWSYADDITCTNGETLRERWAENPLENLGDQVDWDELLSGRAMFLPAEFIWDIMIDGAWRNGEPGLFYLDETNREHSFDVDEHEEYEMHATNPCAEQPLVNHEACNLGHVNLSLMVDDNAKRRDEFDGSIDEYFEHAVDTTELSRTVRGGVRFLDNVATMSDFPLDEIEDTVDEMRKIGLGVMGWAQMLSQMGIEYGSDTSLILANRLMNFIDRQATRASHQIAKERGTFDAWEDSKYANPQEHYEWFAKHVHEDPDDYPDGYEMRNHNVTTVAPTGTTSMIADTTGGIEPYYEVVYRKHVGEDIGDLVEMDSYFTDVLKANDIDVDDVRAEAEEKMTQGTFDGVESLNVVPDDVADAFTTTGEVSPREHTMMQRVFQQGVDSGISKTVNMPSSASRADVAEAYSLALEHDTLGDPIKGMTVYRDQSREEQVMTTQEHSDKELESARDKLEDAGYEIVAPQDCNEAAD